MSNDTDETAPLPERTRPATQPIKGKRQPLSESMERKEFMSKFCEGNVGCVSVVVAVAEQGHFQIQAIMNLVDMNIRGAQVWVAFKDVCQQDVGEFVDRVLKRDPELVRQVNEIMYRPDRKNMPPVHYERAVVSGWLAENS